MWVILSQLNAEKLTVFNLSYGYFDCCLFDFLITAVKHQIFAVSKFGNFKRLTYWRSLILVVSNLMPIKIIFYFHAVFYRGYS